MLLVFWLIIALLLGVIIGTITGMVPGLHVNMVAVLLMAIIPLLPQVPLFSLVIFVVSMSITHTFVDFIPSVFLGSPDEDTALSILPGHELLIQGRGFVAIALSAIGGLIGLVVILVFLPLAFFLIPRIYPPLQTVMFLPLILASLYLLFRGPKRLFFWSLIIFLLSGILGFLTLNFPPLSQPLLPLLTGLFGASSLVVSIIGGSKIPKQSAHSFLDVSVTRRSCVDSFIASFLVAPVCSILPSLGSSQAAVIGSDIMSSRDDSSNDYRRTFLMLLGSINTVVMGVSFIILFIIGRARTGSAVFISQVFSSITSLQSFLIILFIILSGVISFFITLFIAKKISLRIHMVNYRIISLLVLLFLLVMVLSFSGTLGLLVFLTSMFLGLLTITSGVRRIVMMGSLMIPSIIYYLPF